jgi:hypothetical protein
MRLVMERLIAPRKDRAVPFELPKLETAGDAEGNSRNCRRSGVRRCAKWLISVF